MQQRINFADGFGIVPRIDDFLNAGIRIELRDERGEEPLSGVYHIKERIFSRLLRANGFDGLVRPDHTPTLAGERNDNPGYEMLGNLFAVGYIRGILDTLNLK